ncbi:type II secretion system inner membrane protein GspF [Limnobacter parvus]|uniref:Type II secretion system inner membrane protein GspF n=1 Tax=Limnobacter parvus TaxID=2939690 RepID=A0ABT1XDK2_9BURK|nr:type II secretion system inner membrane protein GspF [Limnobacter parvus]MCR2745335.1 type II secretion system inner membrane protein GspF [Limnobacter parvus]
MAVFRYEALSAQGKTVKGSMEADSPRSARNQMRMQGMTPIEVVEVGSTKMTGKKAGRFDRELSNREVVLLTRQLASLLQARLALAQALAALVEQAEKPLIRERINSIRSEVVSGTPLSQALAQYPKAFPEMYVATVAAGENTGDLGGVLSKLADALEARQALQQKVSAAFIYPAIVTVVALMVVVGLLTYVVPQVVSVFENSNQDLPTITVVMIALSDLLRSWGWLMALVVALAVYLFRNALKNKTFKLKFDEGILTVPVVGPFIRAVNTARLASTLSILVGSGVPILKALAAANRTLGNSALQLAMVDVQERVKEGSGLSKAMGKSGLFPPVLTHLVASGEATGQLAAMLERASESQRTEVERKAMWLTSLMEPILILVMGLIVLLIVLAVMMPIIEVNQLIQ